MSYHFYDDDAAYDENYDDEEFCTDEEEDDALSFDDNPLEEGTDNFENLNPPPEQWRSMKVGDTIVEVSTHGRVKSEANRAVFVAATEGLPCAGTPYRLCPVIIDSQPRNVFMHDLVWRAFREDPPEGWCVRHVARPRKDGFYSNALRNLTLLPITVSAWPAKST
jgi:hypothetical protein